MGLSDQTLNIKVTNDGQLSEDKHTGIGLKNIRSRLLMLYANKASFTISQQTIRVAAEVTLPVEAVQFSSQPTHN
ncbi:hypothetical protein QX776_08695 [Alteromonadaceae bacterium BrNp21-10]|nr:hypothetical protein [Alteromonadaceae bacterium BrNp21-10]